MTAWTNLSAWADKARPADAFAGKLNQWLMAATGTDLCERFARANRLWWQMPIAVSWNADAGLYVVEDRAPANAAANQPHRIMIARPERIYRYRRGVAHRVDKLAAKYFIDRVPLSAGDVVIDCGANVGEIGLHVQSRAAVQVIAIEPSAPEAGACDHNVFAGERKTHRLALWHSQGEQTFYDSNTTGDSSLIAPANVPTSATTVPTTTLDRLVATEGVDRIQLLKIEAEGAEPEILAGAAQTLSRVAHCTIDCGPERGPSEAHVIPEVCNRMIGRGFELLDVNLERQIFWFRNRAMG